MNTNKKTARIAGFLYFIYIASSIIGNEFGRFVSVDAPVTINNALSQIHSVGWGGTIRSPMLFV